MNNEITADVGVLSESMAKVDKLEKSIEAALERKRKVIMEGKQIAYDMLSELYGLEGQALVDNSSGKHNGKSRISKRGRKRLRYLLFEAALSLTATNPEFREIHRYYTSRETNPLKKMQSLTALSNKLIRVFYTILKHGTDYDSAKLTSDIRRPEKVAA